MNTDTGEIKDYSEIERLSKEQRKRWIPVTRDLTIKEGNDKQIRLYAPCACGSGKKFKFCCKTKPSDSIVKNITTP